MGLAGSPTPAALALQNAAESTLTANTFVLTGGDSGCGPWRYHAPNSLTAGFCNLVGRAYPAAVVNPQAGSFSYIGRAFSGIGYPSFPPLLFTAQNVTRHGDHYIFVLSLLLEPVHPSLSRKRPDGPTTAVDVKATAVVQGGYLVRMSFPNGIGSGPASLPATAWTFSHLNQG